MLKALPLTLSALAVLVSFTAQAQSDTPAPQVLTPKRAAAPAPAPAAGPQPDFEAIPKGPFPVVRPAARAAAPAETPKAAPAPRKAAATKKEPPKPTIVDAVAGPRKVEPIVEAFRNWVERSPYKPRAEGGAIRFPFGEMEPVIVCAEGRVCLVELRDDEALEFLAIGDTNNWDITVVPQSTRQVVSLKPKASDLDTNLTVATTKRTYSMALKSTKEQYVSRYSFYYPAENVQTFTGQFKVPETPAEAAATAAAAAEPKKTEYQKDFEATLPAPEAVTLAYELKGDAAFKPEKVYSDGSKTFIQMTENINSRELPVLFILDKRGNLGMPTPRYNAAKKMFVVDFVVEKAVLMLGNGKDAQKVEITQAPSKS